MTTSASLSRVPDENGKKYKPLQTPGLRHPRWVRGAARRHATAFWYTLQDTAVLMRFVRCVRMASNVLMVQKQAWKHADSTSAVAVDFRHSTQSATPAVGTHIFLLTCYAIAVVSMSSTPAIVRHRLVGSPLEHATHIFIACTAIGVRVSMERWYMWVMAVHMCVRQCGCVLKSCAARQSPL